MKIVEFHAENVKRLKLVSITPKGNVVIVGGKNGALALSPAIVRFLRTMACASHDRNQVAAFAEMASAVERLAEVAPRETPADPLCGQLESLRLIFLRAGISPRAHGDPSVTHGKNGTAPLTAMPEATR